MHPLLQEAGSSVRTLARDAWALVRRRPWAFLLPLAAGIAFVVLFWPYDVGFSRAFTSERHPDLERAARGIRRWGAFVDSLVFCGLVYLAGVMRRRRGWRSSAIAALMAACLGGLTVNALRLTTGRPRPRTDLPDGFYGPTLTYVMQSFPSGHAGTTFGASSALLVAVPAVGIPAVISSGAIAWASMYTRNHHLTDVTLGSLLGILYGTALGLAARRRRDGSVENPSPPQ